MPDRYSGFGRVRVQVGTLLRWTQGNCGGIYPDNRTLRKASRESEGRMMSKKYCASFPCPNLAVGGAYCAEHRPPRAAKDTDAFYLTTRWRRFREWYLTNHPFCEQCQREGRVGVLAGVVDHRVELKDRGAPTTQENAQSLCRKCHAIKTANAKEKRNKNHQLPYESNRVRSTEDTY